jgi:hypothetical protein
MEGKHLVVGRMRSTEGNVLWNEYVVYNDHKIDKISRGIGGTTISDEV